MSGFKIKEEVVKILENIFPDWRKTVPLDLHSILHDLAVEFSVLEIENFVEHFNNAGKTWGFYPGSTFVRIFLDKVVDLLTNTNFIGKENVDSAFSLLNKGSIDKLFIISNHISYGDANVIASEFSPFMKKYDFKKDFSVVVGPKVYNNKFKKFSSLHFNSLLIAQSRSVATEDASVKYREVANATRKVARDIRKKVKILLIFPEGSRSRSKKLKTFLPGVFRLMNIPGNTAVLPVSIVGTEKLLPINATALNFSDLRLNVGDMIFLEDLKKSFKGKNRKAEIMDELGRAVAKLHPEDQRGVYSKT